jgi:hydroxymethylpyrimidine kinase/phosphomethylpyrimidine kinase
MVDVVQPLSVLSIAGSDSGGGAGIQADLRTFAAYGVHATTALTAITAQNTLGVRDALVLEPDLVVAQILAVTEDFEIAAVKTGMLGDATLVEAVADLARQGLLPQLIVDPVLVSSTRHPLMAEGGVRAYREALFPLAMMVTPNLSEAAQLCDVDVRDVTTVEHMTALAQQLLALGPRYVLVKGGHLTAAENDPPLLYEHVLETLTPERLVPDVLVSASGVIVMNSPRVQTTNDHGTGCTLSAAICAGVALGRSVEDATRDAKSFVLAALQGGAQWHLGRGHGPLDHLGWN